MGRRSKFAYGCVLFDLLVASAEILIRVLSFLLRGCTRAVLQDTAGHERFRTIPAPYYRGAQGAVLGTTFIPHAVLPIFFSTTLAHRRCGKTPRAYIYI
jgi:hypothetical protein